MDENKKRLENTLDFYNEKMTKKAVGRLFQEYIDDGEKNYFIPDDDDDDEEKYNNRYEEPVAETYEDEYYEDLSEEDYQEYQNYNNQPSEKYKYEYSNEDDDDFDDEYAAYMDDEVDVDYNKNYSYDTVKLYSPRRKRGSRGKTVKKEKVRAEKTIKQKTVKETKPKKDSKPKKRYQEEYLNDDYFDEYENKAGKIVTVILGIFSCVLLITVIVLLYKLNIVTAEMKHLSERLNNTAATPSVTEELNALKAQVEILTKENETLKSTQSDNNNNTGEAVNSNITPAANTNTNENEINKKNTEISQDENSTTIPSTYTVVKGDNAWKISKKIYGTGDNYLKILEANNLDGEAALVVGQELVIPQI